MNPPNENVLVFNRSTFRGRGGEKGGKRKERKECLRSAPPNAENDKKKEKKEGKDSVRALQNACEQRRATQEKGGEGKRKGRMSRHYRAGRLSL